MTPKDLDSDVVSSRLRLIEELLADLTAVGELTEDRLLSDRLLRHAVERILTQIVDLAVSVNGHVAVSVVGEAPREYRASFAIAARAGLISEDLASRLQRSVGLRNVLTHEYAEIDLDRVARARGDALADYRDYVQQAGSWLRQRDTT